MTKRIVIRTLPRPPHAIGGEDQIAFYLQDAFEALGYDCTVGFNRIREDADIVLSMGVGDPRPERCRRAIFWRFNESCTREQVLGLGYDVLMSNIVSDDDPFAHVPLAADSSMIADPEADIAKDGIAYLGNLSAYKKGMIERRLLPLSERLGDRLSIYGGTNWTEHDTLGKHYKGILHPDSIPWLRSIARTWIAFRSEGQLVEKMMPDRLYMLAAAGVHRIVTDGPVEPEIAELACVADTDDEWIDACCDDAETMSARNGTSTILDGHLYKHRAVEMLRL